MLDENRIEDLTLFYQLLSRVHHGLKELCIGFAAYIKVLLYICIGSRAGYLYIRVLGLNPLCA